MSINENYSYRVEAWMTDVKGLNLGLAEASIFAIIYGFSRDGNRSFYAGQEFLAKFTHLSTRTVIRTLKELERKELITKISQNKSNGYCVNFAKCKDKKCSPSIPSVTTDSNVTKCHTQVTICHSDVTNCHTNNNINNNINKQTNEIMQNTTSALLLQIAALWNKTIAPLGIPRVTVTENKLIAFKKCLVDFSEANSLVFWQKVMEQIENSPYLFKKKDDGSTWFNFSWLINNQENLAKVKDGYYASRDSESKKLFIAVLDKWNAILPAVGLSKAIATSERLKFFIERIKAHPEANSLEFWEKLFTEIKNTPYLLGNNKISWKVSFAHCIAKEENFARLIEGYWAQNKPVTQCVYYSSDNPAEKLTENPFTKYLAAQKNQKVRMNYVTV